MKTAVECATAFVPDVEVVEESAIRNQNPKAMALTSDGVIYLSDTIPERLSVAVAYHEVVHAIKQRGNQAYLDFLDTIGERVNLAGDQSGVLDIVVKSRFSGKTFFELTYPELDVVYDELNAVIWGCYKDDPENARAQFADAFTDYDAYIAELDAIMEEARRQNQTPGRRAAWGRRRLGLSGPGQRLHG